MWEFNVLNRYSIKSQTQLTKFNSLYFQLAATKCMMELLKIFDPINFIEMWSEYNIFEVSLTFLNSNYICGIDLNCQCHVITISTSLLSGII